MKNYVTLFGILVLSLMIVQEAHAQSCETASKKVETAFGQDEGVANSGCTPSACRGAKTKFGEAKVISDLRLGLIDLKSKMEKHLTIKFNPRTYDIHDIVGQTDDESLEIIKDEIKIIEKELRQKLGVDFSNMEYPKKKAKQVVFLRTRLVELGENL